MSIIFQPDEGVYQYGGGAVAYPGFRNVKFNTFSELHCEQVKKVELSEGDLLSLCNVDGGSTVLLFAIDSDGNEAFSAIGLGDSPTSETHFDCFEAAPLEQFLSAHNIAGNNISARRVFDNQTLAGEQLVFQSQGDLTLWLALPRPVDVSYPGGGTVTIEHNRKEETVSTLPEPLGKLKDEFRVNRATAKAYTVKAGEYIQVIDVEGRQCSDFMAVRTDKLEQGVERFIDSTVTRTMVGSAYPGPGLYDKFFDQDMQPLLVVVQDTVGRHDTFALACTARGYEERGFPGHVNCSDNISEAYLPFGITPRAAWPAINFFFNSTINPHTNHLLSDEAWSRPGDYVVMKALTDLVCVSTACPDDIDPINAWNPTDIHVRIYSEDNDIPMAIAHRPFTESEKNMTAESAFHARTSALTQSFVVARDLWLPTSYEATRAVEEYWACRNSVTVQDMSSLRKYDVMGPDAEKLLQLCMTRDVAKLAISRGIYTLLCNETGGVIDDGTLFRLEPALFRWCCGSEESARQLKTIAHENNFRVWIKAMWSSMPNLAVQGPKSRELLSRLVFTQPTHPALDNIKWFGFTIARLYDRNGPIFMLTRSGFTGELGYEIFCDKTSALPIWDALMKEGKDLGIVPMGGEALEMKRIEAGLMVAGAEITPDVDAFEAGLGFAVDMKKTSFIGREALVRNASAPRRKLIGIKLQGTEVPHHGAPIFVGRNQVGVVTSATYSPQLQQVIGFARVAIEYTQEGTVLEVGCLDGYIKRLQAHACTFPFVDPKRERARA